MIKVGLGVRVSCMVRVSVRNIFLRLGLVPGLYKWLFYLATVRQLKTRRTSNGITSPIRPPTLRNITSSVTSSNVER